MDCLISKRLAYIADFVDKDMLIADIGSDHGYLPLYLFKKGIIQYAYASDNKNGPYQNLLSTFKNTSFNIKCALNDGLNNLPSEVNTLIITGMGGDLIISILEKGKQYLNNIESMILSPHQNIPGLRKYLNSIGYKIVDEGIVFDDKFYHVIKVKRGSQKLSDYEYKYGNILLAKKDNDFINYLKEKKEYFLSIYNKPNLDKKRLDFLKNELNELSTILGEKDEF